MRDFAAVAAEHVVAVDVMTSDALGQRFWIYDIHLRDGSIITIDDDGSTEALRFIRGHGFDPHGLLSGILACAGYDAWERLYP
jgi:hypothetical protein